MNKVVYANLGANKGEKMNNYKFNKMTQSIEMDKAVFKNILMQELNCIVFDAPPEMNVVFENLIDRILKRVIYKGKLSVKISEVIE